MDTARVLGLACLLATPALAGCTGDRGGEDPAPPERWAPFPLDDCLVMLAAGHVPSQRVAKAMPFGFRPSDTPGFLGLPARPLNATVAVLGAGCASGAAGRDELGASTSLHFLVAVIQPPGAPFARDATGFYDLGAATTDAPLSAALAELGFEAFDGSATLETRNSTDGRWSAKLVGRPEQAAARIETDVEAGQAPRTGIRLYTAGPDGLSFLTGNITAGLGGTGPATFSFGDETPLAGMTTKRVVLGQALVARAAALGDMRSYHHGAWTPAP